MKNNTSTTFKVAKSQTVLGITWGVMILLGLGILPLFSLSANHPETRIVTIPTVLIAFGVMFYYYLLSPRYVTVTPEAIVLRTVKGRKAFKFDDIAEADAWKDSPYKLFRTWGNGGLFGFIGWFTCPGLGRHFEYVGRYDQAFYIHLRSGRTYLLSCEGRDEVVRHIKRMKNEE